MQNTNSNGDHILQWGSYLARGVLPKSTHVPSRVVELVESYFESEGVSRFSSKMAVAFLQVCTNLKYFLLSKNNEFFFAESIAEASGANGSCSVVLAFKVITTMLKCYKIRSFFNGIE